MHAMLFARIISNGAQFGFVSVYYPVDEGCDPFGWPHGVGLRGVQVGNVSV
jgi:hypothetical protein